MSADRPALPGDSASRGRQDDTLDKLADQLRMAAFPGARSWKLASEVTRNVWRQAAEMASSRIEREVDKVLREATAKAHEIGQHAAAKAIREMRANRWRGGDG